MKFPAGYNIIYSVLQEFFYPGLSHWNKDRVRWLHWHPFSRVHHILILHEKCDGLVNAVGYKLPGRAVLLSPAVPFSVLDNLLGNNSYPSGKYRWKNRD